LFRPLLLWVVGITFYTLFPVRELSFALPAIVVVVILASCIVSKQSDASMSEWKARWLWGAVFALTIIFLAIQMTALAEYKALHPSVSEPPFYMRLAVQLRDAMTEKLSRLNLPDDYVNVLASITLGFRQKMPRALGTQFSVSGVAHILVVSGFHVGIVFAFVRTALAFLPNRYIVSAALKYIVSLLLVWAYACIAGLGLATVRAALMISFFIIGTAINRRGDKYNTLAAAAFCQLVYNPLDLFNAGFQLSYVAVLSILYLQPRFDKALAIVNPVIKYPWSAISVSIAAQAGISFLLFYYFGNISLVFIFTNLLLTFISLILIPLTLLWLLMPDGLAAVATLFQPVIEAMVRFLMKVVLTFSSFPWATLDVRFDVFTLVASYTGFCMLLLWFRQKYYYQLFAALACLTLILLRYAIFL